MEALLSVAFIPHLAEAGYQSAQDIVAGQEKSEDVGVLEGSPKQSLGLEGQKTFSIKKIDNGGSSF